MYWLAEICVKRPVFALMLILALVVAGVAAFPNLGVDRFPNIDMPSVFVSTRYVGASAAEVETEITQVVEDAVATVAGIEELRSVSSEGSSFVIATFELSRNVDAAVQDVRDAVAGVSRSLPFSVDPPVIEKSDLESSPIMTLAISGPRSPNELFFLAERYVKGVIESAQGVGDVFIAGAADRAVQVEIDARRLAARGISILQVRDALSRQNVDIPGGRVDEGLRERSLRTLGRVDESRNFPDLVIDTVNGTPVRLSDLGTVKDATKELRTMARLNGQPAVVVQIQKQSGANTVRVIEEVKKRLPRCRDLLPADCIVTPLQDQSRYILAALHEIERHLISGSILACLIVLLFMRSWRSTVIAAVAIPTSIIGTFAFMRAFGFTLNNVTMLALVLMVGVVIDDAIVVLENVFHCVEEKRMSPRDAAIKGTKEIGFAVLSTTISLVIVFLPVSFLSSVTGRMLFQFGVTASIAILISMFVSFTLTPMMCSKLLRPVTGSAGAGTPQSRRGFYHWIEVSYMECLRWAMKARWVVLLCSIGVIASNFWLYRLVKQDYIPTNVDESEFEVSLSAREGTSLRSMDEAMLAAEKELRSIDGIELMLSTVGTRGFGGVNRGDIFVRLRDIDERSFSLQRWWDGLRRGDPWGAFRGNFSQRDKMTEVRGRLSKIPNVRSSVRNLTSMRTGSFADIDFSVTGPDIPRLFEFSETLKKRVAETPGIVDTDSTLKMDKPELLVTIDRERAAAMGVDVAEIAETLRVSVGGDQRVSRYRDANVDDAYDVELRLVGIDRQDVESISQLYVRGTPPRTGGPNSGGRGTGVNASGSSPLIRIDNLVQFHFGDSLARIDRLDRQRMVAVRANVAPGFALADRITAVQAIVQDIGVPPGFATRVMGRGRELDRTLNEFVWTFLMSFIFMYIVLAAQFENMIHPFTILLTLPLAVPFGLISLYWGGETLNVYSALGILVLFGVVKKAAILQVDHTNALRAAGVPRSEAILQANRDRLRPILMTTFSFVAGLLPLLVATGPGAEERRSIAVLAVGGQTLSLLLTLLAVPAIYSILDDFSLLLARVFRVAPSDRSETPPRLASE